MVVTKSKGRRKGQRAEADNINSSDAPGTSSGPVMEPGFKRLKRPPGPFVLFKAGLGKDMMKEGRKLNKNEISKFAAEKWKSMTDKEQEPYKNAHKLSWEEYLGQVGRKPKKAVTFKTRCCPKPLYLLAKKLDEVKRKAVEEIGFGGLLQIKTQNLKKDFCEELTNRFNHSNLSFRVTDEESISIFEHDVADCLGIPKGPRSVQPVSSTGSFPFSRTMKISEMIGMLLQMEAGDDFKRLFVLFACASLLYPDARGVPNDKLWSNLVNVDDISTFNWSRLVLDGLVTANNNKQIGKAYYQGCVFFLMIFYLDRVCVDGCIHTRTVPHVAIWTTDRISTRLAIEERNKKEEHPKPLKIRGPHNRYINDNRPSTSRQIHARGRFDHVEDPFVRDQLEAISFLQNDFNTAIEHRLNALSDYFAGKGTIQQRGTRDRSRKRARVQQIDDESSFEESEGEETDGDEEEEVKDGSEEESDEEIEEEVGDLNASMDVGSEDSEDDLDGSEDGDKMLEDGIVEEDVVVSEDRDSLRAYNEKRAAVETTGEHVQCEGESPSTHVFTTPSALYGPENIGVYSQTSQSNMNLNDYQDFRSRTVQTFGAQFVDDAAEVIDKEKTLCTMQVLDEALTKVNEMNVDPTAVAASDLIDMSGTTQPEETVDATPYARPSETHIATVNANVDDLRAERVITTPDARPAETSIPSPEPGQPKHIPKQNVRRTKRSRFLNSSDHVLGTTESLTDEERKISAMVFDSNAQPGEQLFNCDGLIVRRQDMQSLMPRKCVNSPVINAFGKLINAKDDPRSQFSKYIFSSDLALRISTQSVGRKGLKTLEPWFRFYFPIAKLDFIRNCNMLMFPWCHSEHWVLVAVSHGSKQIFYLDPMKNHAMDGYDNFLKNLFLVLKLFLGMDISSYVREIPDVPHQSTTFDCGVLVMKYMEEWNGKMRSNLTQGSNAPFYRKQIATFLINHPMNTCAMPQMSHEKR